MEFAVEDSVPYAIDFMNPAPDADFYSIGQDNFHWIVDAVAQLAIQKAQAGPKLNGEVRCLSLLNGEPGVTKQMQAVAKAVLSKAKAAPSKSSSRGTARKKTAADRPEPGRKKAPQAPRSATKDPLSL